MKRFAAILVVCLAITKSYGQTSFLSDTTDVHNLANEVVEMFYQNEVLKATDLMRPYWPLPEEELKAFEDKTIEYLNLYEERFGKSIGHLKLSQKSIADIAIRETHLVRYEYIAIRLIFTFYKGENGWIVNSFKWDDNFDEEFK